MPSSRVDAYRTQTIETADPVTLVSLLYDGTLKALRRSRLHHEAGRRGECFDNVGRAALIIGELMVSLDMEQGEVAEGLSALYAYCMRRLSEATWDEVPAVTSEVERHIQRIADAWKQAAPRVASAGSTRIGGEVAA